MTSVLPGLAMFLFPQDSVTHHSVASGRLGFYLVTLVSRTQSTSGSKWAIRLVKSLSWKVSAGYSFHEWQRKG